MFTRLLHKLQEHQMRRVAYWQLHSLSERQLKDMGLNRGDIRRIAYKEPI
jgi:uncharacterized protein YjiS (DUF1127 family)